VRLSPNSATVTFLRQCGQGLKDIGCTVITQTVSHGKAVFPLRLRVIALRGER